MSCVMSTAEAVSVYYQSALDAEYFGGGQISMSKLTENLLGAVLKESRDDLPKLREYYSGSIKLKAERRGGIWNEFYDSRSFLK